MNITGTTHKQTLTIRIHDKFDFSIHREFRGCYKDIVPGSIQQVQVDLQHVTYMDSAALGMLLLLQEHFSQLRIHLMHANQHVRQVLDIANFHKKFSISPT